MPSRQHNGVSDMADQVTDGFTARSAAGTEYDIEEVCDVTYEHVPARAASYDPLTKVNRPAKDAFTKEHRGTARYRLKGTEIPVTQNADGTWRFTGSNGVVILKA
jgi:hypothetical protein